MGADVSLLSLEYIKRENTELVPGALLIKYGILTFASTTGGNAICMDLNEISDGEPEIIIADHSIFSGQEITIFEKGRLKKYRLSYKVIRQYAPKISKTFTYFIKMLINEKITDIED